MIGLSGNQFHKITPEISRIAKVLQISGAFLWSLLFRDLAPVDRSKVWNPQATTGYIYLTENQINHRWYIGQHHWEKPGIDTSYYGSGIAIKEAIDKYGKENFTCIPIDWAYSKEELDEKEVWWISYFRTLSPYEGYNIANGGYACSWSDGNYPMSGKHHSEETKKKMSEQRRGENHPRYGKHLSEEHKNKLREAQLGRHHTEETRKKMSESKKGEKNNMYKKHHTEEARRKISEAKRKNKSSKETKNPRAKITEETKRKTICHKGIKNSRAKLTEKDVLEIVELHNNGLSYAKIAPMFNVKPAAIYKICNGITWSHITGIIYNLKHKINKHST